MRRRYEILADLIKEHGWTSGVEVGVFQGATFFYLLEHCPKLVLTGVDRWEVDRHKQKDIEKGYSGYKLSADQWEEMALSVIGKCPARGRILRMDSVEAAKEIPDESQDFVFIDAEHTTESVQADIDAWLPKVKFGGWLMGHDGWWPSVKRGVGSRFDRWNELEDHIWAIPIGENWERKAG